MWRFYALMALCIAACFVSGVCDGATFGMLAGCLVIGVLCERRGWKPRKGFVALAGLAFVCLLAKDILRYENFSEFWIHAFLDIIWTLFAYRAMSHETRAQRVQMGILGAIVLTCIAYVLSAAELVAFLVPYVLILFVYFGDLSLLEPSTGAIAYLSRPASGGKSAVKGARWRLLGHAAAVLAAVFAVAFSLFLIMPRSNGAALISPVGASTGGFSDVSIDKSGKIALDPSLIFRVAMPRMPDPVYWRLNVGLSFDGVRWFGDFQNKLDARRPDDGASLGRYRVEFVRPWRDWRLPSIDGTRWMELHAEEPDREFRIGVDRENAWRRGWRDAHVPLVGIDLYVTGDVKNDMAISQSRENRIWPDPRRDKAAHARLRALAQKIVGDAQSDAQKAARIQSYLKTHYEYSLERRKQDGHSIEDFLFKHPQGHCEVFSTAMAVLLASLDVNVRNVAGFVSDEYRDGMLHVRAAHAHSWVEAYDPETGWQRYDPTPSGSRSVEVTWLVRLNDWFDGYHSQDIYRLIEKRIAWFGVAFVCFGAVGLAIFRRIRIYAQSPRIYARQLWREFVRICMRDAATKPYGVRSFEDWFLAHDSLNLRAFSQAIIRVRFADETDRLPLPARIAANRQMRRSYAKACSAIKKLQKSRRGKKDVENGN